MYFLSRCDMLKKTTHAQRVVGCSTVLEAASSWVRFPRMSLDFSMNLAFEQHYSAGVDAASDKNGYHEFFWG
jgi:hypothetical protein